MIYIKTIGIIIREFKENQIDFMGTRKDLFEVFSSYPIKVIGIPIHTEFIKIKNIISKCQGVVLSGGNSFHPNDFKLVEYLIQKNIPTLGICLGMQTMAEYFNNKQEIKVENHYLTNHIIKINKNSLLYKIIGQEQILVNSRHHTAIPDTDLFVSARSEDYVIEAVELPNHKFFLGLEWHPESLDNQDSKKIFDYFVKII